jgi:drug/metabolite transporter (DMT)-like permease
VYLCWDVLYRSLSTCLFHTGDIHLLFHTYPVSELAVFTFLSPVFGVVFGSFILNEEVTKGLLIGLILVSLGIYLTNYRK